MRYSLLLLVIVTLIGSKCLAQSHHYQFGRIDIAKGLSHQTVNDILKDSTGYLWFATASGLNRYDGYSIKVFRTIPGDSTSLGANEINRICEGPNGMLWLFSHAGNNVYNPKTETFIRNTNQMLTEMNIATGLITFIKKDRAGNFWFIHYNQGLYCYKPATKETFRLVPKEGDNGSISSLKMSALEEDSNGHMWLVHQNGTFEKIDPLTMRVVYRNVELRERFGNQLFDYILMIDADNDLWMASDRNFGCFQFEVAENRLTNFNRSSATKLTSNIVKKVVQDNEGKIWIGTENGGVNVIDKNDHSIITLLNDEEDNRSLSENSIHSMLKDRDGIIWLGTYKSGISFYHPDIFRFQMYKYQRSKSNGLPFRDINALAGDALGNLWIGTNGGGLIYFDRAKNSYRQYLHDPSNPHSLSNNVVVSLLLDHENMLWIGTYYGGLNRFDGKQFHHYLHDASNPKTPGDDNAWTIMEDSERNLWLGTLKAGVDVYDRKRNEFYHYKNGEPNSIHTSYVPAIAEDTNGNIWMGTGYGVEMLDRQSGRFIHYLNAPKDSTSISDNGTTSIIQDHRGLIWIGTHSGLNLYNPKTRSFRVYREEDGLGSNYILSLIEDNDHNIWIGTPQGLSKLMIKESSGPQSPEKQAEFSFTNYGESDGLWGSAFHENAAVKLLTGELAFGGLQGFIIFQPNGITEDKTVSNVVFTDFQLFNRSVKIGESRKGDVVLPAAMPYLKEIILKPYNNIFSIGFTALDFFHPEKTKYRYKLDGFNKEWLTTEGSQRSITFTNLDPGDYSFQVLASNSDGGWTAEPATIHIRVLPPFWKSNTALVLYFVFIMGSLLLVRWLTLSRLKMNFRIHHEKLEAQRMHELDTMKIKFFTNVSHEFRTPLTLIITPLEKLIAKSSGDDVAQLQVINRNARRLLNLVNQLLDFRKVEVQEVKLNTSEGDIVGFIKYLVYSFSDLSEKKNIHLSFTTTVPQLETFFDQDKVEKILFNLLSNAFKFTSEGGNVKVELSLKEKDGDNFLLVKVIDTGIGIPADKHQKIFERFYQNDLPENLVNQGSGIGLSITAEFVKVHGGSIEVESEPGKGSCFTVSLPITRLESETVMNYVRNGEEDAELSEAPEQSGKPVILLVEDNEDFRYYLKDNLKSHYTILEAANGKAGVQKAQAVVPDLIVSDIMMPEVHGIDLCKKIRSDVRTSHIPVILLTARAAEEQKIEGFEAGANDYITKPFSFEILQSRIKNLLSQREASQKQFQKHFDVKASNIEVTSLDEKLIKRAIEVVEQNIMEPDFSIENLSQELGMSRVYLYKKLVSLTGKSPLDFVKSIRLQQAAQLLEKSDLNVSEVAYRVGFSNPKYFAKCFKEEYKVLPSAYATSQQSEKK
ncbi:two-component regulator propeller domain-containing protein [Chryseolinea sp. T2]|uniref:two-component regulator propeller domain-containing protein n=1 Tax=Chryseolinea sp. T2 TaxID=3129255 RepID=UPI0030768B54